MGEVGANYEEGVIGDEGEFAGVEKDIEEKIEFVEKVDGREG